MDNIEKDALLATLRVAQVTVDAGQAVDEVRGSMPVMTTKDLLLEVYHDMKFVRPAVEGLLAAGVIGRIESLERDRLVITTARDERGRIGSLTNRGLVVVILVTQFLVGLVVAFSNLNSM